MQYTNSDGLAVHQATGRSLHQDTLPVTTEVSPEDMNSIMWSLMDVLNAAGVPGSSFNADLPATYSRLTEAIKTLISRASLPVVPEGTRSIAGLNLDELGLPSGLYTYAHGNAQNLNHPVGFPGYGLMFLIIGTSFELQAIWSEIQGIAYRVRFVGNAWSGMPWQEVQTTRSLATTFAVGGLPSWYYPVLIAPRERDWDLPANAGVPATYDFEIYRADANAGGNLLGAFSLRVSCLPGRWGHFPAKVLSTNYQVGLGSGGYQAPVGNVQASAYTDACVVWLRGGASYGLRSLTPSAPVQLKAGNAAGAAQTDLNNTVYAPTTQAYLRPGHIIYGRDFNGGALAPVFGPTSWTRRTDGLIEQWGVTGIVPADSLLAVTFPVAFPNATINVMATAGGAVIATNGESQSFGTRDHTLSGFTLVNDSAQQVAYWRALGY